MRCIWLKSLFDFLIKTLFKSWLYASAVTFLLLLICSYIDMYGAQNETYIED